MTHAILMHNPTAGHGQYAKDDLLALLKKNGYEVRYQSTKEDDYALALEEPAELVIVAGGDGTVGKVARQHKQDIPIALLPLGTANNITRGLGITSSPEELVRGWQSAQRQAFTIGLAKGPWGELQFLEAVGVGLFPQVMKALPKRKEALQLRFRNAEEEVHFDRLFLKETLEAYQEKHWQVTLDGHDLSGRYLLVEAMNIPSIGPNLRLAPDANPEDAFLEVVLVGEEEREDLLQYLNERLAGNESLLTLPTRKVKRLQLVCKASEAHVDDEVWPEEGSVNLIDVSLEAKKLTFLV
jgi:diacylglycerol kinase (ATP)